MPETSRLGHEAQRLWLVPLARRDDRASQLHAAKLEAAARADHVARVMGLPIDTGRERPGFPLQTHAAGTPRRMPVATRVASHALQSA
jgi:hypothetical protein